MRNRFERSPGCLLAMVIFLIAVLALEYREYRTCSDRGGTLIRGAVELVCVALPTVPEAPP